MLLAKTKTVTFEPPPAASGQLCQNTHIRARERIAAGDLCRKTGTSEIREHSKLILFDLFSKDMLRLLWTVDKKTNFPWVVVEGGHAHPVRRGLGAPAWPHLSPEMRFSLISLKGNSSACRSLDI